MMAIFKRGATYWFEFEFLGQRIRQSSHSRNKEVCERLMRERRRALELGHGGLTKIARPKKFGTAARAYLIDREPHWEPKTRLVHSNSLAHLDPHFGKLTLPEITPAHISRYQRARLKQNASPRSINIEVALIRLVLRKAKLWANIQDEVKMLKERRDVGRELSDDEVHRLLTACKASTSRGLYPAVLTSIHTGLRSQELRLLRWRQVDLIEGTIIVGKSKTQGGEGRLVYLSASAVQTLQNWRAQFPDAQPDHALFPREAYGLKGKKGSFGGTVVPYKVFPEQPIQSFKTAWQTAKKAACVECRWQDLRHSCTSHLAAGGATDQTLQALLGWMSPKMIERYSHVRAEAKRKAVRVFDEPLDLEGPPNSHHSKSNSEKDSRLTN
jgi:integrase